MRALDNFLPWNQSKTHDTFLPSSSSFQLCVVRLEAVGARAHRLLSCFFHSLKLLISLARNIFFARLACSYSQRNSESTQASVDVLFGQAAIFKRNTAFIRYSTSTNLTFQPEDGDWPGPTIRGNCLTIYRFPIPTGGDMVQDLRMLLSGDRISLQL